MKRVLIFSREATWFGGVVNFIALLNRNLGDEIESVPFVIGRRTGFSGVLLRPLVPLLDTFRLARLLRRERFDAYHVNPSLNYSSLLRDGIFLLVLRLARVENVIVSFHGWDGPVERRIKSSRMLLATFRYFFGYATHTLVLAEAFRDWLVNVAGLNVASVRIFTTMFDDAEFREVRDVLTHDDNCVLFLSRLVREKGIYELVDAFLMLAPDYPGLKLVIAGNGPEEARLRDYIEKTGISDRVSFTGYVRGADKVRILKAAGLFVFPSYYGEGCPVSLLEAMAAGLPLVTTRAGGIPHIVKDLENGLLLNKCDAWRNSNSHAPVAGQQAAERDNAQHEYARGMGVLQCAGCDAVVRKTVCGCRGRCQCREIAGSRYLSWVHLARVRHSPPKSLAGIHACLCRARPITSMMFTPAPRNWATRETARCVWRLHVACIPSMAVFTSRRTSYA